MCKLRNFVLLTALMLPLLFAQAANAGADKRLVDVDPDTALQRERVAKQECERELADKNLELLNAQRACNQETAQLKEEIRDLKAELANQASGADLNGLKRDIALLEQSNAQLKAANTKLNTDYSILLETLKACQGNSSSGHHFGNYLAPFVSAPIGTVVGTARGAVTKGIDHSEDAAEMLGGGVTGNLIGRAPGFVLGTIPGAVTGMLKGFKDGIITGYREPFSLESISLAGHFINDFDSYKF